MEKDYPAVSHVESPHVTQEAGAKEVFELLINYFYQPQHVREMMTVQETIDTACDYPNTRIVPKQGIGSLERITSTTLHDPGLQVRQEEGGFRITRMRKNSSAVYCEIEVGDLIVSVNGMPVDHNNMSASTTQLFKELVTGDKGSVISLFVQRKGRAKKVQIPLSSIRRYAELSETGRSDICAVRIDKFAANTCSDVSNALRLCNPRQVKGVILDLRGNGGGMVDSAVEIASLFIGEGKEVMSEVRRESVKPYKTQKHATFPDLTVGMLVDRQSASASEILVGALRHHKNSLVVGQQTFGKGIIQIEYDIHSLPDQRLKMTTSQWMTPDGTHINRKGLRPHIYVNDVRLSSRERIDEAMQIAADGLACELPKKKPHSKRCRNSHGKR